MNNFEQSGLKPELIKAVKEMGFVSPTPVQAEAIPFILNTREDLIANAQTGTGKTAAFGLPILHQLDPNNKGIQALVLSPTRELAIQIEKDLKQYAQYLPSISTLAVYGGASIETQIKALAKGVQIVAGTPGRVLDLIKRKKLKLQSIRFLVLDEADEMLNMGFKEELDAILQTTPAERQTLLFSATMPDEILRISHHYMHNPEHIAVSKVNSGAENVAHHVYRVAARDKYAALKRIADMNPSIYAIVFCRTRRETHEIAEKLAKDKYNADALHGDLSQAQRDQVMKRFRSRNLQILVATDVAARGLDVNDLTHVINYSLPDDPEVYVHRSGRTGRAGKKGISISISHNREQRKIRDIEKFIGRKFERKAVPGGREICEKQLFNLVDKMEKVDLSHSDMDSFMSIIYSKLSYLSKEEIIKRFVAVEFNRFLDYYKGARDLNVAESDERPGRNRERNKRGQRTEEKEGRRRRSSSNFSRFYINLGSKNHLNPASLIGLVNKATPNDSVDIGQIEILKKFAFFEADSSMNHKIMQGMNGLSYRGEEVMVEEAENRKSPDRPKKKKKETSAQRRKKRR